MGALQAWRVVELSADGSAFAGKLLADMGADVVVVEPPGGSPQRRYGPFDYSGGSSPDFNVRSFRTTNVLRWEFKPGSTLFVVWQQAREGSAPHGDFRFGRDFGGVFRSPARNVFLIKMAYWLNY